MNYVRVKVSFLNNLPTRELSQHLSSVLPGYYVIITDCMKVQRNLVEAWRGYQIGCNKAVEFNGKPYVLSRGIVDSYDAKCAENGDVYEIAFLNQGNLVYATLASYAINFITPVFEKTKEEIKELFSSLPFFKEIQFWDYEIINNMEPSPKFIEMARCLESGELQTRDIPQTILSIPFCDSVLNKQTSDIDEQNLYVKQDDNDRITVSLNGVDFVFVKCPRGRFIMGSPNVRQMAFPNGFMTDTHYLYSPAESLQMPRKQNEAMHEVELSQDFWLLETPVTQKGWTSLMEYNPSRNNEMDCPVDQVNYYMTLEFITKLNSILVNSNYECRLPTEAEWEYASRAGVNNTSRYSDDINNLAWTDSRTHKVKCLHPNNWGLYDMLGNVAEWVADWYDDYQTGLHIDPVGPESGEFKVLRGGGFLTCSLECRSAYRHFAPPQMRYPLFGFRLVLTKIADVFQ